LKSEVTSKIVNKTILYGFAIALLYYLTVMESSPLILEVGLTGGPLIIERRPIFEPVTLFLVLRYLSNVVSTLLTGSLIGPVKRTLSQLSWTASAWLLSRQYPALLFLEIISLYLTVLVSGQGILGAARTVSMERDNTVMLLVTRFFNVLFTGLILNRFLAGDASFIFGKIADIPLNVFSGLSDLVLTCSIVAATLSLGAFLENSDNTYVSYFMKIVNKEPTVNFIKVFLLLAYILYFRGYLSSAIERGAPYLSYFEWAVITTYAFLTFRSVRIYVAEELTNPDILGEWKKHLQEIKTRSDYRIDRLAKVVDDFINEGSKDVLLVYLICLLSSEHLPESIANEFKDLINYQKKDVGLVTFSWNQEYILKEDARRRREIISELLPRFEMLSIKAGYIGSINEVRKEDLNEVRESKGTL